MTRLVLVFLLLIGCTPGDRNAADEEEVPIGPGSDSTALMPLDTPVSRRQPATPGGPPAPDTTP